MCKINNYRLITFFVLIFLSTPLWSQQSYQSATVAFYNVENLFDTIVSADYIDGTRKPDDPLYHISISRSDISKYDTVYFRNRYTYENIDGKKIIRPLILQDEEFSPRGKKEWNTEKYYRKLHQISSVIFQLGKDETQNAPVIVGLSEVETKEVVEDLVNQPVLKPYNYGVVHFNSFDARGIDLALIYQKDRFKVTLAKPYPIEIFGTDGKKIYTRDILRVTGLLDGEEFTFLVNHWPSRSGGEKKSMPNRMRAAEEVKKIFDQIRAENPNAKIIAMGDFNDDPVSLSVKQGIGTLANKEKIKKEDIYNPMESLYKKGVGTLAYRDSWNLFDQFFITGSLIDNDKRFDSYKVYKVEVFSPEYLHSPDGPYKGYPYRMFGGDTYYPNGFSDHFPIYTVLIRKTK